MPSLAHQNAIKLANILDPVAAFGADPSGVTKSTTALTNSVGVGAVKLTLGPGTFLIDPIVFSGKNSVTIEGAGIGATVIALATSGVCLTFSNCQWLRIANLTIRLSGAPQGVASTVGIRLDSGSSNCHIDRVSFEGFQSDGAQIFGTVGTQLSGNKVTNCYFLGNGGKQLYCLYSNDFHISDNQFGRLAGVTRAQHGAYLENCSAGNYTGNYHWENGIGCSMLSGNFNRIIGNRFEENQTNGYYQFGGAYTKFVGNDLYANSEAGTGNHDGAYFASASFLTIDGTQTPIFNSTRHKWDINVDGSCDNLNWGDNKLNNFNPSFGPLRIDGTSVDTAASDNAVSFTSASISTGTDHFIGPNGASTAENDAIHLVMFRSTVLRLYAACTVAPGAGQSFAFVLRLNGVDTSMTFSITGTATAGAVSGATPSILLLPESRVTIKMTRSASAAASNIRVGLLLAEY